MPCSKYKSKKQRGLCYVTKGWKDFSRVRKRSLLGHGIVKRRKVCPKFRRTIRYITKK
jgi:hypothetical protein